MPLGCVRGAPKAVCELCPAAQLRSLGKQQDSGEFWGTGKWETIPLCSSNSGLTLSWGTQDPVPLTNPNPARSQGPGLTFRAALGSI